MYDIHTIRKIEALKRKKKKNKEENPKPNPLGLTKQEQRLAEQVNEFMELAVNPFERAAYEKVLLTINLNALARNK